jgi:hypothetical protein
MGEGGGIVEKALSSLGRGFDFTSDFRLNYCKGKRRLVLLNEQHTRELHVPGFGAFRDVSADIKCDKGDRTRYKSDILNFNQVRFFFVVIVFVVVLEFMTHAGILAVQMSEFFNQKSSVPGKIPSGFFNSVFGFRSDSWATDAADTKFLGLDGYFIILFNVRIDRFALVLSDEVREAVPTSWDPFALAR